MSSACPLVALFESLCHIPEIGRGTLQPNHERQDGAPTVVLQVSHRDIDMDAKREFELSFSPSSTNPLSYTPVGFPTESSYLHRSVSPSGRYVLIVKKFVHPKLPPPPAAAAPSIPSMSLPTNHYQFDVFDRSSSSLLSTIYNFPFSPSPSFTPLSHNKILFASQFAQFQWNNEEDAILYVADRFSGEAVKGYGDKRGGEQKKGESKDGEGKDKDVSTSYGKQYDWVEDYGEQLNHIQTPRPFILDIKRRVIVEVKEGIADDMAFIHPIWASSKNNGDSSIYGDIICSGWSVEPRRFGMIYYNTRPSKLYAIRVKDVPSADKKEGKRTSSMSSNVVCLTPSNEDYSCVLPRLHPNNPFEVLFLTSANTVLHCAASMLKTVNISDVFSSPSVLPPSRTIIPLMSKPSSISTFPGIYTGFAGFPRHLFLTNNIVVIQSEWRSTTTLVYAEVKPQWLTEGEVRRVPIPEECKGFCANLLDIDHVSQSILVSFSSPSSPPCVYVGVARNGTSSLHIEWSSVYDALASCSPSLVDPSVKKRVQSIHCEVFQIPVDEKDALPFEAFLLTPQKRESTRTKPPLVLFPHGGPHGLTVNNFSLSSSYLASVGFAVLYPNFRGSIGFGEESLKALPGKVGTLDVKDCIASVEYVKKAYGDFVDCGRVCVTGGSHGGFLTTHLIGQYPDLFHAAVARNPVVNISHMEASTDIIDWCYVECGVDFSLTAPNAMDETILSKMFSHSPIRHISNVKTPLMLLLGSGDRRVPMAQSFDYARQLKALWRSRGMSGEEISRKLRVLVYPEAQHGLLDKVAHEVDAWINTALWLMMRFETEKQSGDDYWNLLPSAIDTE